MSQPGGTDGVVEDDRPDGQSTGGDDTPDPGEPRGAAGAAGAAPAASEPHRAHGATVPSESRSVVSATTGSSPGEDAAAEGTAGTAGSGRRTALVVAGVTGVLAIPLVVALVAVRTPPWYPLVDLAQIEMRVRDVGTAHPPLVGLGGRIFGLGTQDSHPGPVSFYLLAPVYRLVGSSPWALQVSAATLNIVVLATTVWAAHRRRGVAGALFAAAGLALAMRIYGTVVLLYPWNPYLPVLFWALFLVCVWGVLCDDLVLVPVAVAAGCVCAQTHIPYVGLVAGLGAVMAAGLVSSWRRHRGDAAARRRLLRWSGAGVTLGVALWIPVFAEQLGGDPGNISVIVDSIRHPSAPAVGLGSAWRLLAQHLDVTLLVRGDRSTPGSEWVGLGLVAVWGASAAVAVRLRDHELVRLHGVTAAALVLGLVSISRILGSPWFYLTLWMFVTAVLALAAVVATAATAGAAAAARRRLGDHPAPLGRLPWAVLGLTAIVPTVLLTRAAPDTADTDAAESAQLAELIPPTVAAIEGGTIPGADGIMVVTWADPVNLGGQGLGLMLELERRGYDARAPQHNELSVREHRVLVDPAEADSEIHVATGQPAIEAARSHPGAVEVTYDDPRTEEQIAAYRDLRQLVIDRLTAEGLDELVVEADRNLFALRDDDRMPDDLQTALYVMEQLPQPVAVVSWELPAR